MPDTSVESSPVVVLQPITPFCILTKSMLARLAGVPSGLTAQSMSKAESSALLGRLSTYPYSNDENTYWLFTKLALSGSRVAVNDRVSLSYHCG